MNHFHHGWESVGLFRNFIDLLMQTSRFRSWIHRLVLGAIATLLIFSTLNTEMKPAHAAPICKEIQGQQVCINKMKRSAKNYWEYWAIVDVDGHLRPKETYNCRDRVVIDSANILVPFTREIAGDFVCQLYVEKQTYLDRLNPPPILTSSSESKSTP